MLARGRTWIFGPKKKDKKTSQNQIKSEDTRENIPEQPKRASQSPPRELRKSASEPKRTSVGSHKQDVQRSSVDQEMQTVSSKSVGHPPLHYPQPAGGISKFSTTEGSEGMEVKGKKSTGPIPRKEGPVLLRKNPPVFGHRPQTGWEPHGSTVLLPQSSV